jgi:hypothetical protein
MDFALQCQAGLLLIATRVLKKLVILLCNVVLRPRDHLAHTYADRQDTKKSKKIVSPSVPHRDSISDSDDGLDLSVALERSQRQPLMHTSVH